MGVLEGLEEVIDCLDTGSVSIERRSGAFYDSDGNSQRGAAVTFAVAPAVVHVATGRDLLRLPEGDRTREVIIVFTKTRLRTGLEASGKEADVVVYGSQDAVSRYVVRTSEDWIGASNHYKCLAVRKEDG
jgi:hypothetical protein